jgi:hypothetical protein
MTEQIEVGDTVKVMSFYPAFVLKLIKKASKIKWLTKEYIREQAKISDRAALVCSLEHHKQGIEASGEELAKARDNQFDIVSSFCACCYRWARCEYGCPLWPGKDNRSCCSEYVIMALEYAPGEDKSAYNAAAQALCDRIQREIDKIDAAEKKIDKIDTEVTYKPGDKFMVQGYSMPSMLVQHANEIALVTSYGKSHKGWHEVLDVKCITKEEVNHMSHFRVTPISSEKK